jgi:hypothetical protein
MKHLIWADRIALVWWILLAIAIQLMHAVPSPIIGDPYILNTFAGMVGIPWLIMRGIDFIFTGTIRFGR